MPLRRTALALALIAPLLGSARGRASEIQEMDAVMTCVCQAALAPAMSWLEAVMPYATASEVAAITRAVAVATEACAVGDPGQGAREAAMLARLAGRIESRLGQTGDLWPERQVNR